MGTVGTLSGSVTIPSTIDGQSVTAIGASAFLGQTQLSRISIPASVESIGSNAFPPGCRIELAAGRTQIQSWLFQKQPQVSQITIPGSVTQIGANAFSGATGLISITNNAVTPQEIDGTVFAGIDRSNIRLKVPEGTELLYEEAGWAGFIIDGLYETRQIAGDIFSHKKVHRYSGVTVKEPHKYQIKTVRVGGQFITRYTCTVCGYTYETKPGIQPLLPTRLPLLPERIKENTAA
jgi:hypothetical protein